MKPLLFIMGLLSFLAACSRPKLVDGGIYCTRAEEGGYSVLEILKLDEHGVHVRLDPKKEPSQSPQLMAPSRHGSS